MGCNASKDKKKETETKLDTATPELSKSMFMTINTFMDGFKDPATDNKILTDKGLAPLTETQIKVFNKFLTESVKWIEGEKPKTFEKAIYYLDVNQERKKIFDAADTDSDSLLNKAEMIGMLKQLLSESSESYDAAGYDRWHACIASVNAETGESCAWEDFTRMLEVIRA